MTRHHALGGAGALELADAVVDACDQPTDFQFLYDLKLPIKARCAESPLPPTRLGCARSPAGWPAAGLSAGPSARSPRPSTRAAEMTLQGARGSDPSFANRQASSLPPQQHMRMRLLLFFPLCLTYARRLA